jgi:plastocyanin
MMNMNKYKVNRFMVIGAVLVALVILATGCSSSKTTPYAATTTSVAPPVSTAAANTVTINISAQNVAFDQSAITVKAGAQVTMVFNNQDSMPHNVAIYTDKSASQVIYKGEVFSGPATKTYTFTAPSATGNYFFRCDVHPGKMTGQFIVE